MTGSGFDRSMMARCIKLAEQAKAAGAVPVGSVIAIGEEVAAEAAERVQSADAPFAHAEFAAIVKACQRTGFDVLRRATLYTTKEPCFLCSYAIRETRIPRIVYAVETPEIGGATSRFPILSATEIQRWGNPPSIEAGLLASEYRCLLMD